jgi:SNF2 family DNA or RNA helicase
MPDAKWDQEERVRRVSLALRDRDRLLEIADRLGLEVHPSLREYHLSPAAQRAAQAGLYPYQVEGVDWLAGRTRALLADEMGLGKTAQALFALPEKAAALVICPASVKCHWRDEARRWRPDLAVTVLQGRGSFRLPQPGEIVVANYEILPQDIAGIGWLLRGDDFRKAAAGVSLIVDEAHYVKNPEANRSQQVQALAGLARSVWGLTGTPLLSRPDDLFGLLCVLGLDREAFGSRANFKKLFHARPNQWGGIDWGEPDPEVPGMLERVMLRRTRQEVFPDPPEKQYETVVLDHTKDLGHHLDDLWQEYGGQLQAKLELPPFEKFAEVREQLAQERIRAMLKLTSEFEENGVPLVVFSAHLAPIKALAGRAGWAVITGQTPHEKRYAIVEDFQAGRLKGVGLTIKAGGTGLNLSRAQAVLFVDLEWTPAVNVQAEDRVCRICQQADKVRIIRLVSDHPLDRRVLEILDQKAKLIQATVERASS